MAVGDETKVDASSTAVLNEKASECRLEAGAPGSANGAPASRRHSGARASSPHSTHFWGVAILLTLVAGFFWKTVILGLPISKICRLAEWDSLFFEQSSGLTGLMDPSSVQLMIPTYFVVANFFQTGILPLWNPYVGFGSPLLADPQSTVFSPLRLLFNLAPTMHSYNLYLIGQVALACVTAYFLARALGLGLVASVFAATCYAFCPTNLRGLELGFCYPILPLVSLAFVQAAKNPTPGRAIAAGAACSLAIYCGHPESAFWGIAFACWLFLLLRACQGRTVREVFAAAVSGIKVILIAGIVAFLLSAPMLLPFIEYLIHSDSYKFSVTFPTCVPLIAQLYNLMSPGFSEASAFIGSIAIVLAGFSFFSRTELKRYAVAMTLAAIVAIAFTGRVGPLHNWLATRPLNVIICVYCLPLMILSVSMLAGFGAQALRDMISTRVSRSALVYLLIGSLTIVLVPSLCGWFKVDLSAGHYDMMLPNMAVSFTAIKRDAILLAVSALMLLVSFKFRLGKPELVLVLLVGSNLISVWSVAKGTLPIQPKFEYASVPAFERVRESGQRMIAVGSHLAKPATNAVYKVADVRSHNPLFPKGFINFMRKSGAQIDLYNQTFGDVLKKGIDLASVKYVLSLGALRSVDDAEPVGGTQTNDLGITVLPEFKLQTVTHWSEEPNHHLLFKLRWESPRSNVQLKRILDRYSCTVVVLDETGNAVWCSDIEPLADFLIRTATFTDKAGPLVRTLKFACPLPSETSSKLLFGVKVFDNQNYQAVEPEGAAVRQGVIVLGAVPPPVKMTSSRFKLIEEYPGRIRLYENMTALPTAYLSYNTSISNEFEVWQRISSPQFKPNREVSVQGGGARILKSDRAVQSAQYERVSPTEVLVRGNAHDDAVVVLTDSYFPGWVATVDGKESAIVCVNGMFRGVYVGAGNHEVRFQYKPVSLIYGVAAFAFCTMMIVAYGLFSLVRRLRKA